ncbi:DUF3429 domain-containing protein [Kushneria indalinina]|uniref:Uncharacterized protein DUF3429 n=1 Tax=Kushneria indalinina DSM 14324 TaxID=1122140 RepID=A0A3D9DY32_9GAMM|nr:DUF3429 domain-containing protein [Kushneria indalinina]REC95688.1 uncharacterized protein DUF3429 [Kushneria indalinina DSM 14324]
MLSGKKIVALPWLLGIAGLTPFIGLAAVVLLAVPGWQAIALQAFLYYSAVILSFLGGIHWGVAMSLDHEGGHHFSSRMMVAMAPSLLAWPALMLSPRFALLALMTGFLLIRLYEAQADSVERLPPWYTSLRTLLTVVVVVAHLSILLLLTLT